MDRPPAVGMPAASVSLVFVLLGLLTAISDAGPALAQTPTTMYIEANAVMGGGRYEDAAGLFEQILRIDSGHHRAQAGYASAVFSAHSFHGRMTDRLPLAAERIASAIQSEARPERWKLLGDIQKARALGIWNPNQAPDTVSPGSLQAARGLWARAATAYRQAGKSLDGGETERVSNRIDTYLADRYESALLPGRNLLGRCASGYLPVRSEFNECRESAEAGRPFLPDDPRLDRLVSDLAAARRRTLDELASLANRASEGKHWEELKRRADHMLDLDRSDQRGFGFLAKAEEYLRLIDQNGQDLRTAESSGDHELLRRTADWLIENTDRPEEFISKVMAANEGIFRDAIGTKNWEKAEGCLSFSERYGWDMGRMKVELFFYRHLYYLVGATIAVSALVFAVLYLLAKRRRRKKEDELVKGADEHILSLDLASAWRSVSEAWETDGEGRGDRLTVRLCQIVESPGFPEWAVLDDNKEGILAFLSEGFEAASDPELKVRAARARGNAGWSEDSWSESLSILRRWRDAYPVIDGLWRLPLEILQGQGPSWLWYPDDGEQRRALHEAMADDVRAWVRRSPKTAADLGTVIEKALTDASAGAVRWAYGLEFVSLEMWSEAEHHLQGFLYGREEWPDEDGLDELRVTWARRLTSKPEPLSDEEAALFARVLSSARADREERASWHLRVAAYLNGLGSERRAGETISLLLEPFRRESLPPEGIEMIAAALHERAACAEGELEVIAAALRVRFSEEHFLYLARLTARFEGWGALEELVRSEVERHSVDVVNLESATRQELAASRSANP
ncbi:MAG: hypothetical protein ABIK65_14790 [Candidatus Eisenbacteria bacterium]